MILPAISFTPEGGLAVRLINKSGGASVRGTIVTAFGSLSMSFTTAAADADMPIGTVYDAGVADGSPCRIVVAGVGPVLMKNTVAAVRGYVLYCSSTAGRADAAGTVPVAATHFKEIGHCLESATGGTDILVRAILHFN